jgi:hypothetical protein
VKWHRESVGARPLSLPCKRALHFGPEEGHVIVSSDTTSPSDENHAPGLWLWNGKASLPSLPPQPASASNDFLIRSSLPCEEEDG